MDTNICPNLEERIAERWKSLEHSKYYFSEYTEVYPAVITEIKVHPYSENDCDIAFVFMVSNGFYRKKFYRICRHIFTDGKENFRNFYLSLMLPDLDYYSENEGTLQNGRYQFNHIFTNKRGHFQEFCEGLGLFDEQTHQLDLSKALGTYCIVDFNTQDYELTIRPAHERDMRRERNLSILNSASIADTIEDIPEMIQNYYYFLSYPKKEIPYVTHFGCITGYDFFPDKDNPDDETLRLDVAIFNSGYPKHFQYYLNRINTDGHDNFIEFCENFDITDEKNDIYLDDVLFIPCSVKLYPARSSKVYVSEAVPLSVENKYHQKQFYLMCYAYHNYLNSNLYDMFAFDEL